MNLLYPKILVSFKQRCLRQTWQLTHRFVNPRTQLAVFTLFAVLQKSPALVRALNTVKFSIEPSTRILQKITIAAAALGSYQAISGATQFVAATTSPTRLDFEGLGPFQFSMNVGEELRFGLAVTLEDAGHLADSWQVTESVPPGLLIAGNTGNTPNAQGLFNALNLNITGIPTVAGSFLFKLQPFNGPNGTEDTINPVSITINVIGNNATPTLVSPIPDQMGEENFAFELDVSSHFSDSDAGDSLSYSAVQSDESDLPDWLLLNSQTGRFSGTPTLADVGTITVVVTASDGSDSVSDTFAIEVIAERIPVRAEVAVEPIGSEFRFRWPVQTEQSYRLEKSANGKDWTLDTRAIAEELGAQSANFSLAEIDQRLLIRVETDIIR